MDNGEQSPTGNVSNGYDKRACMNKYTNCVMRVGTNSGAVGGSMRVYVWSLQSYRTDLKIRVPLQQEKA